MRKIVLFIGTMIVTLFALIQNCTNSNVQNDEKRQLESGLDRIEEQKLLDSLGFDQFVVTSIRKYTDAAIFLKTTSFDFYNEESRQFESNVKMHKGITFKVSAKDAEAVVISLKDQFTEKGYVIYISETNFGYSPDEVSILKTTDQFDILRVEQTAGYNYDLNNEDVLAKLKKWYSEFAYEIIGASDASVEAVFKGEGPNDAKAFAQKVYAFCPDVVDQGVGSVDELEREIVQMKGFFLWWD